MEGGAGACRVGGRCLPCGRAPAAYDLRSRLRGNYPRLSALAQSLPLFPRVQNERSMLYIDTLCAFVERLADSGAGGLYFPQNREYVSTCAMVREIAACHGRRVRLVPG